MKKISLQYKCRRCGERYFNPPKADWLGWRQVAPTSILMIDTHDCNDNDDKSRFGIADLIGYKEE